MSVLKRDSSTSLRMTSGKYMTSITDTLIKYGFEPSTAEIYLILANNGEMTVPQITEKTEFSRASIYDSLGQLLAQDFVEYRKEGRVAFYKPVHPNKLFGLIEQKKREGTLLEEEMKDSIKSLIGAYNLAENKPGVRFFEGKIGMIEAYEAILDIGETIYSFEDSGEMMDFFPDYVEKFVKKRVGSKIWSKSIVPDTNKINEPDKSRFIDSRKIPAVDFPFDMDIKICANILQFATLKEGQAVAIHVNHPIIAKNFKIIFDFMWKQLSSKDVERQKTETSKNLDPSTLIAFDS